MDGNSENSLTQDKDRIRNLIVRVCENGKPTQETEITKLIDQLKFYADQNRPEIIEIIVSYIVDSISLLI